MTGAARASHDDRLRRRRLLLVTLTVLRFRYPEGAEPETHDTRSTSDDELRAPELDENTERVDYLDYEAAKDRPRRTDRGSPAGKPGAGRSAAPPE